MMQRQQGMTLMELLVVVVIVGILAGVAYPSYRQYAIRANRTEAKTAMLQAAQALERCYTRKHSYDDCDDVEDGKTPSKLYDISVNVDDQTFLVTATPQEGQDDEKCGTLTLDNTGKRTERGDKDVDPSKKCW